MFYLLQLVLILGIAAVFGPVYAVLTFAALLFVAVFIKVRTRSYDEDEFPEDVNGDEPVDHA